MTIILSFPWWALALMVVGVIGLGTLILNLFSSVGDRPGQATVARPCALDSIDFLLALSGVLNAPLHAGGTARLLNNGDEFYPAMLKAIREAERTVNFTTYIWQGGEVSDAFFEALVEAAERGVEVRILVDGWGGLKTPRNDIERLRAVGGKWERFNVPTFGKLTRLHKRTHRRALLVDGRVGFTGGAAIMDKWLGNAQDADHWRDCMVEVRGRLALSLQSTFAQLWAHSTGELLSGQEFYDLDAHEAESEGKGERIRRHLSVISSPSGEAHPMRPLFWYSIRCAKERIYITNPYFVPDDIMADALMERARAGVDVRVLVPNEKIDVLVIRWASRSYYEQLMEAGIRIFEYQPTMIHQKLLVADGVWSLFGSTNMDVRSKELNQENTLGILDRGFAAELEDTFLADLQRAEEVDLERWRRRPWYYRIPERFFRLFEEQF